MSFRKSPSHVSRAISRLEARLGERLFQRNTRIVTPTEFAHAFADRCRHMVEDRIGAFALSDGQGPPRGALNVTCSIAFGERVIAPLIRHFVKQYPQVIATDRKSVGQGKGGSVRVDSGGRRMRKKK